jgi:tripartite-type tricarboxylate transporter receptor subunit TctC
LKSFGKIKQKFRRNSMRKLLIPIICAVLSFPVFGTPAFSGDFPDRRLKISFPWKAGGPAFVLSQIIADGMSKDLGVDISVVATPGAGGVKSFMSAFGEPADGYTIIDGWVAPLVIAPIFEKADYSYQDVIPLHGAGASPFAIASRVEEDRWTDFSSLMEYMRENPGKTRFTASAELTLPHMIAASMLKSQNLVSRNVPYVGLFPGVKDLRGGLLDWVIVNPGVYKGNKDHLRILAVLSEDDDAVDLYDGAPKVSDFGVDIGLSGLAQMGWTWFVVKAGTPDEVVTRLRKAMSASLNNPVVQQKIADIGFLPLDYTSDDYEQIVGQVDKDLRDAMTGVQWLRDELK